MNQGNYSNFEGLKYFKPVGTSDRWTEPEKISRRLLEELDKFRDYLGKPVYVTSGFRRGDIGQHGKGLAADIVVPSLEGSPLDLFLEASRFNFKGIGVYPDWRFDGLVVGGLHLDMRDADKRAMWIGYTLPSGGKKYLALTSENLQKVQGIL